MPGPAPKDPSSRRRRNATVGKTMLPAGGRQGDVPVWPILARTEPDVWADLWRTPQASAWEAQGWTRVVARYALLIEATEDPNPENSPSAAILAEVRQMEDRLGLNPKAMRSLLWEVTSDEVAERRDGSKVSKATSKRAELKIVG